MPPRWVSWASAWLGHEVDVAAQDLAHGARPGCGKGCALSCFDLGQSIRQFGVRLARHGHTLERPNADNAKALRRFDQRLLSPSVGWGAGFRVAAAVALGRNLQWPKMLLIDLIKESAAQKSMDSFTRSAEIGTGVDFFIRILHHSSSTPSGVEEILKLLSSGQAS